MPEFDQARIERALRRVGFWLPLIICTWLALADELPKSAPKVSDVPLHLFAFVYLSAALSFAHLRVQWWWVALLMMGYGGMIELIQSWLPHRDAEWKDFLVDLVGIGVGLLSYRLFGERLWQLLIVPLVQWYLKRSRGLD